MDIDKQTALEMKHIAAKNVTDYRNQPNHPPCIEGCSIDLLYDDFTDIELETAIKICSRLEQISDEINEDKLGELIAHLIDYQLEQKQKDNDFPDIIDD